MKKCISVLIKSDFVREGALGKIDRIKIFFRYPKIRYLIALRIASHTSVYTFSGLLSRFFYRHYSFKLGYQISIHAQIGKGLYLGHWGALVVHPNAIIREYCSMTQGVIVGQVNRGKQRYSYY